MVQMDGLPRRHPTPYVLALPPSTQASASTAASLATLEVIARFPWTNAYIATSRFGGRYAPTCSESLQEFGWCRQVITDHRARGERCPQLGVICVHQARCEGYLSKPVPWRRISHESTQSPVLSRINTTLLLYQNHIHPLYCHHHPPPSVSRFLVLSTCFSHQFSNFNIIQLYPYAYLSSFLSIIFSWAQSQASSFLVFFFSSFFLFFATLCIPPMSLNSLLFIDLYSEP